MTRPSNVPPPGSPLQGLSGVLSELFRAANRDDMPAAGTFGGEGTAATNSPRCSLATFCLTSAFQNDAPSPTWPSAPNSNWWWATATRVEYYPSTANPPNNWAPPAGQGDWATQPEQVTVWAPAAIVQNNITYDNLAYVTCFYDESAGCWIVVAPPPTLCHATATPAFQTFAAGSHLINMIPGSPNNGIATGDGATGNIQILTKGTYLVMAGITAAATYGNLTPIVGFTLTIAKNGSPTNANSAEDADGHFHSTATAAITIPKNSLIFTDSVTGAAVTGPNADATYYEAAPALGNTTYAPGSISAAKTLSFAANDQVGVYIACPDVVLVTNAYLVVYRIGP